MSEGIEINEQSAGTLANKVLVDKDQLNTMIAQLEEYKADIIQLVSVFGTFGKLLDGKTSVMKAIPVITKILSNKAQLEKLAVIVPILDKYTESNNNA